MEKMLADNSSTILSNSASESRPKEIDYRSKAFITSGDAQLLLSALHNFITPLIHTNAIYNVDRDISWGTEANELVSALEKFISAIVMASQPKKQDDINVNIQEDDEPSSVTDLSPGTSTLLEEAVTRTTDDPNVEANPDQFQNRISMEKLLAGLRQHVFNTMPIRLLCFETHGSELKIKLIERGGIYAHLASILQQTSNEAEFLSDLQQAVQWYGDRTFAEEKVIDKWVSKTARYAILSHTWIRAAPGEVIYSDWIKGELDAHQAGYRKLVNFCKTAAKAHGVTLGWMDTVCINKDSSAELDESIRTMYKWYRDSAVCITYLAETTQLREVHNDPWFTRGWTLQELLAPRRIKFYDTHWREIIEVIDNDKRDSQIRAEIKRATTITREELVNIHGVSISRRMQWAAKREVTREEDAAYSLMGIFDVSISIAYGEGAERAFFRLVREILSSSPNILDVFNWAGELPVPWKRISALLPSKPQQYLWRAPNVQLDEIRPIDPVTLTHLGLRIPILLMPATSSLQNNPYTPMGSYHAIAQIIPWDNTNDQQIPNTYNLLEMRVDGKDGWVNERFQLTFGILNFGGDEVSIRVPKTCLAVGLSCQEEAGRVTTLGKVAKIDTYAPVVFQLSNRAGGYKDEAEEEENEYKIERTDLGYHGMQLVTLYL